MVMKGDLKAGNFYVLQGSSFSANAVVAPDFETTKIWNIYTSWAYEGTWYGRIEQEVVIMVAMLIPLISVSTMFSIITRV
jgi:hypothetical protein